MTDISLQKFSSDMKDSRNCTKNLSNGANLTVVSKLFVLC